ncbi:UDP-glycosyltransferase 76C5-like [Panicum virgatum]|uniref:Uncharacterized protein n=1 Tax=Panicum virgatum TaxID=38727 RepID=A0A8T0Q1K7_PANVG|nr:UDP-glycosyltransferase 76C5-like [Panicum virgatum]KAG2567175.1 hypothetical protein PVAP13_7NG253700 [Panicum virgatum]
MLQLAGALRARGLAVTILHTAFNAPDPARHPGLAFVAVPDAIPEAAGANGIAKILALNAAMEASGRVRAALASLMATAAAEGSPGWRAWSSTPPSPPPRRPPPPSACPRSCSTPAIKELPPLKVSDLFNPSKLPNKKIGQRILNLATETTTNSSSAILNTF